MQTIYYNTSNYVRHTGNVVDLGEYRRRMALAQADSQPAPAPQAGEGELPSLRPARPRRSARRARQALWLDACASLGVVVMTLTFTLHILMA